LFTKSDGVIHVETFELSPRNEAVNTTLGRLQRQFPGPTFALDQDTYNEPGLQHTIAQTLTRMSHQSVAGTKPKVKKAGYQHDEERDTTNPIMVTEFFTAFLRPRCTVVESLQIQKNTREEVLWRDSKLPWRRSPMWLLIRATLQLVLRRLCVQEGVSDDLYKHFMVYYMSVILNISFEKICSEHRYIMTAKIARRLRKLDLPKSPAWFPTVQDALKRANGVIRRSWRSIMVENNLQHDPLRLANLDFDKDIYCSLPGLDQWLERIDRRGLSPALAEFRPQSKLLQFQSTELPSRLDLTDHDYKLVNLAAFEDWVDSHLENWLRIHLGHEETCQQLGELISHYYGVALPLYSPNPEAVSIMLLTILELWIACDKSAMYIHPMLNDYDSCIPMDMFESLVVPYRSQMIRLARAEEYMYRRQLRIRYCGSGIFQEFGTPSCFPVRYFDQSNEHQSLLVAIEEHARCERTAKQAELS
jgi:hypothetical protein